MLRETFVILRRLVEDYTLLEENIELEAFFEAWFMFNVRRDKKYEEIKKEVWRAFLRVLKK